MIANKPCSFDVNTRMVNGDAPLFVGITCKMLFSVLRSAESLQHFTGVITDLDLLTYLHLLGVSGLVVRLSDS